MILAMPYTSNHRGVTGFVIVEPDGDRPYFCHKLPLEYLRNASDRGGRVYAFELDFHTGIVPGTVREIAVTRGKVFADLADAMADASQSSMDFAYKDDEVELHQLRRRALLDAAMNCRILEAVDRRLFELHPKIDPAVRTTVSKPSIGPTTLFWRGSVTDLATDLRGELSEREVSELIAALSEPKHGGGAV